jgi:hypothetical protein
VTYTNDLLNGIAALLAAEGVGVWRPDDVIEPGEVGLFRGVLPDEPDVAIALNDYPVADDDTTNAITAIQFRMRAGRDPNVIANLADAVFNRLHQRRQYRVGDLYIALSWRQSQAWIGQDAQGRMELTSNFYFRTVRSGTYLTD